jgi:two-component system response regulator BaeR
VTSILIVEDEPDLAALLRDYLQQATFDVAIITDGSQVIPWLATHDPRLILLDLMLPGKDGLEICREIRQASDVPIIMVTARVDEIDRLLGLELGADDYICKPYSPREVVARVRAVLRRGQLPSPTMSGISVDRERFKVKIDGSDIDLTVVEFKLFALLFDEPGRIYSRDQIIARIYTDYRVVSDRTVDSHIKKLRKKLQLVVPDQELIFAVYGAGYKFEPPA